MKGDPEPSFTLGFGVFSPLVVTVVNLTWKSKKNVVFISVEVAVTPGGGCNSWLFVFFFFFKKVGKNSKKLVSIIRSFCLIFFVKSCTYDFKCGRLVELHGGGV